MFSDYSEDINKTTNPSMLGCCPFDIKEVPFHNSFSIFIAILLAGGSLAFFIPLLYVNHLITQII